ncbi:luciferase family protein [Paenibacillus hamazuiensis]|uniref:luciferase domain-containing protein n=1 Tax=Paenibacillus hamazuiensis TaxID=2936508 RepID=UPI00200E1BB8|nr:luciferase family protein [Paenibacillus hamazuiensis]
MTLSARQALSGQLLSWPEVKEQPHRFGGIEFQYKGKEIGHLHGDYLLDVLLPKALRDQFVAEGRAEPHHIYPDSGWISFYIRSSEDIAKAAELLRIKYDHMVQKETGR